MSRIYIPVSEYRTVKGEPLVDSKPVGRPRVSSQRTCTRGHDTSKEGVYLEERRGKYGTYLTKHCRRCRIEDVQNWRKRQTKKAKRVKQ